VQETGVEGAGSTIPEVAGSGREREKLCNSLQYFTMKKVLKDTGSGKLIPTTPPYNVEQSFVSKETTLYWHSPGSNHRRKFRWKV